MRRRQFLSALPALPALAATSGLLKSANGHANIDSWQAEFASALADNPSLLGFRSVTAPAFDSEAHLEGNIPNGLSGTLFRNGPARHEIGNFRYHHWFEGDGMIQAFRINPDGITHRARMVATHKYLAELDAGRALYPGFATMPPDPAPVTSPDKVNVGNISVLPHHGKLYALWEAGSPWEIDPETLETRGLHNFADVKGNIGLTKGLPFSAHPRIEPDGTLWNFGYLSTVGKLVFWHIDSSGVVKKVGAIDCDPMTMPHDFVVTSRHLIILLPPFNFTATDQISTFLDAHEWQPDQPTRVLVVDKNDFSQHRFLELPAQWVFHYGNAWEDESGVIRFDAARAADPLAMTNSFREIMKGTHRDSSQTTHYQYRIDTRSWTISEQPLLSGISSEFPAIDPRVSCNRYSQVVMLTSEQDNPPAHGMLSAVSRFNLDTGKLDTFKYPDTVIPEEHVFVPKPGSANESEGWVVGTALDYANARTELRIFSAENLSDGPQVTASLPYALPLGLHGKFV
jgi:all-trans-8'-apo-beta-carotenal 15,15'-oxygenase